MVKTLLGNQEGSNKCHNVKTFSVVYNQKYTILFLNMASQEWSSINESIIEILHHILYDFSHPRNSLFDCDMM